MELLTTFQKNWSTKYPGERLPKLEIIHTLSPDPKSQPIHSLEPGSAKAKKAVKAVDQDIRHCQSQIQTLELELAKQRYVLGNLHQIQGSLMAAGVKAGSSDEESESRPASAGFSSFKPKAQERKHPPKPAPKPVPSDRKASLQENATRPTSDRGDKKLEPVATTLPSIPGFVNINAINARSKAPDSPKAKPKHDSSGTDYVNLDSTERGRWTKSDGSETEDKGPNSAAAIAARIKTNENPFKDDADPYQGPLHELITRQQSDAETYGQLWSARSQRAEDSSSVDSLQREDEGSDTVPELTPGTGSAQEVDSRSLRAKSYLMAQRAAPVVDSSSTGGYSTAEVEMLETRQMVVNSIIQSEEDYVASLNTLVQYMKLFRVSASTQEALLKEEDVKAIFSNLPVIAQQHETFLDTLRQRMSSSQPVWSKCVGDLFKERSSSLDQYGDYIRSYPRALSALSKSAQASVKFSELTKEVKVKKGGDKRVEVLSLEVLLHKPISRVQRNSLALNDLLRYTPTKHPDHEPLKASLEITGYFLKQFKDPLEESMEQEQRHSVKGSYVVEYTGNGRKLRYVCLFNDIIVCCKHKNTAKDSLEVKWYIPLSELFFGVDDMEHTESERREHTERVKTLKQRVMTTREQLKYELDSMSQKSAETSGSSSIRWKSRSISRGSRTVDKLRKKLSEQEGQLVLSSPNLPVHVRHGRDTDKSYVLLMASDFERQEWREMIKILQRKGAGGQSISMLEVQSAIQSLPEVPKVNSIGSALMNDGRDEELFFGHLNVTVHNLLGLRFAADTHCAIELDSFGHFNTVAQSSTCFQEKNPKWNQDFELPLEGASVLRVLCYQRQDSQDILLGKKALTIDRGWLTSKGVHHDIQLTDLKLSLTTRYMPPEMTMKRNPSKAKSGVFGVKLEKVAKLEGGSVPRIVLYCTESVEKRGLKETGLYRISGSNSEVQALKKAFEKSANGARQKLLETDINAICGLLKLYFRELPESLITDELYPLLKKGSCLGEPEARRNFLSSLLQKLPDANYQTIIHMLDHLLLVNEHESENKMSLHNLSTIFGPTLLRPCASGTAGDTDTFSDTAMGAMDQMRIMHCLLEVRLAEKSD